MVHGASHTRIQRFVPYGVVALLTCGWGAILYQPWRPGPLSLTDFSDFLPVLQGQSGAWAQYHAMSAYYAAQGRFFPVTVAWIVARWSWLGLSGPAWQLTPIPLMVVAVVAVYALLRRLGSGTQGALLGAALYVVGSGARELWLIPQLGDTVGLLLVLGAVGLATRYQQSGEPALVAGAIACLLLGAEWTKETFVACAPFVTGVALCFRGRGIWEKPRVTARSAVLLALVGSTLALGLIPILLIRVAAVTGAYASQYGLRAMTARHVFNILGHMLLPVAGESGSAANLAFLLLLVVGWALALSSGRRDRSMRIGLLVALLLPLSGTAVYLPWPFFLPQYTSAFLFCSAYLAAMAASELYGARSRVLRLLPTGAAVVVIAAGSRAAFSTAEENLATRRVIGATVAVLPPSGQADAIILPGSTPLYAPGWFEVRFEEYAKSAFAHPVPPVRGATCSGGANEWVSQLRVVLVVLAWRCGPLPTLPPPTWRIVQTYRRISFLRMQSTLDSAEVDVWGPRGG